MKKNITLFTVFSLFVLFSCTKITGVDVTQTFDASTYYSKLEVSDGMDVTVTDEVTDIVITADEGVMEKIRVIATNGSLQIYRKDVGLVYVTKAEVLLPYNPDLRQVTVSFDSKFNTPYTIEGDQVKVKVDERSEFKGYLLANKLEMTVQHNSTVDATFDVSDRMDLKIESSSDAFLDGYAPTVHLTMNDNATLEKQWNGIFYAFMCNYCYGTMYSNCTAYIDCEEEIDLNISQNCYVYYTSDPYITGSYDENSDFIYGGY